MTGFDAKMNDFKGKIKGKNVKSPQDIYKFPVELDRI